MVEPPPVMVKLIGGVARSMGFGVMALTPGLGRLTLDGEQDAANEAEAGGAGLVIDLDGNRSGGESREGPAQAGGTGREGNGEVGGGAKPQGGGLGGGL